MKVKSDSSAQELRERSEALIKVCSKLLDIRKPIKLSIEPEDTEAMAAVRKLKNGSEVDDLSEDYDMIELFVYENKELRSFDEYRSFVLLLGEIIHELIHIKHPDWNEDSVSDEDARITEIILDHMEKKE
jgi:hypothetical protein